MQPDIQGHPEQEPEQIDEAAHAQLTSERFFSRAFRDELAPSDTKPEATRDFRRKIIFTPIKLLAASVFVLAGLAMAIVVIGSHRNTQAAQNSAQPSAALTTKATTSQSGATAVIPQKENPRDEWREATPEVRRSMLATRVRRTWRGVAVQDTGAVMTITHPGMDEEGAHKIIDDVGALAGEAGLRRMNFISAGGMCQVTYTYPYCEYACSDQGYCSASESHPCLGCCIAHGYPISHIPATRQEACPTHTWVYDVPPA